MLEIKLTYSTPEGMHEIAIEGEKTSFGRGSEADHRFTDEGLSRLHAVIYRDGDNAWVVDENSTNGTFVNGEKTRPSGTPLKDGDIVRIGNHTNMRLSFVDRPVSFAAPQNSPAISDQSIPGAAAAPISILPIALIAGAIFIISVSAVFIGFTVFGSGRTEIVQNTDYDPDVDRPPKSDPKESPTPKSGNTPGNNSSVDNTSLPIATESPTTGNLVDLPPGKKYLEMTDTERRKYLEAKAMKVAEVIGNNSGGAIPAAAIDKIKSFADAYASRSKVKPLGGCRFGDNLQATFERASKNAPFVVRAFNEKGIDPRIGLYLAMIESEHCVCLQSPTGPLGMFQFTKATAAIHGLKVFAGASPTNPDERCEPEPAARAAASYMKALTGRYGTGPSSVPLAIGSYNSGEGGLSTNLDKALNSGQGLPRDFWTLIAKGDLLSKQFQAENFKYVPKFFAAAIIGENPQDFGLNLRPVSTYSK